jgi:hypothetical protein
MKRERRPEREGRKILKRKIGTKNERNWDRKKGMKRNMEEIKNKKHNSSN